MKKKKFEHILVIEDNEDTQLLLRYLLETKYEISIVTRVDEALEQVADTVFDLLLVDINLGEQRTGVDLLNILRGMDEYARIPMIALTAYAMPGDFERFISMGFDGYIGKPFTRTELYKAINSILDPEETC